MQDRLDQGGLTSEEHDLANAVLSTACSAPCADAALTAMMRWFALSGWNFALMLEAVGAYACAPPTSSRRWSATADPTSASRHPSPPIEQDHDSVTVTAREGGRAHGLGGRWSRCR